MAPPVLIKGSLCKKACSRSAMAELIPRLSKVWTKSMSDSVCGVGE
jgi:hypothetical protein